MTPERREQVERLYHAAVELEAGPRTAFLAAACGSDDELRREVESLLAAHDEAGSLIVAPALEVVAKVLADGQTNAAAEMQEALTQQFSASTRTIAHS